MVRAVKINEGGLSNIAAIAILGIIKTTDRAS